MLKLSGLDRHFKWTDYEAFDLWTITHYLASLELCDIGKKVGFKEFGYYHEFLSPYFYNTSAQFSGIFSLTISSLFQG